MNFFFINRNFFSMWLSQLSSILSGRLRELVIPLLVLGMTHSPLTAGLVALSQQIGVILFAIPVGTWMEQKNKRIVMVITKFLSTICMFILAFLVFQNYINSLLIAFLLFFMGILGLFSSTAFNVMIPAVAGRKNLINAHTSLEGADAVSTLVGPILAGFLFAKMGASFTLLICSILSVISLIFIYIVRYEEQVNTVSDKSLSIKEKMIDFSKRSSEGFKYLFANFSQIISTISICVLGFTTVFIPLTVVIHANNTLNLSPELTGLLLSFAGVGNIIGVVILKWFKNPNWIPFLSILLLVSATGIFLVMITSELWLSCLGMFLFDGALSMAFVIQAAVHQGVTPDEALSRIRSATYVLGGLIAMFASFLSGAIAQYASTTIALGLGIIVLIISAIYIIRYRNHSVKIDKLEPIYLEKKELAN
ncbi:MFS transporter [Lysinibacillus xylanilyticus]|uniref:MFS transporter n=1 Tax=Lysinibacillus xylanilyticus TaxID=582475 RepID=UPI00380DC5D2